jgi:uncharacterized protein YacL
MRGKVWETRLIFLLTLGLVGSLGFDWWMGLVGLGIGLVAVGIEMLFHRMPAEEILYALVGGSAGLVLGVLIVFVLRMGNISLAGSGRYGGDPLVMVPLALGFAMAHVSISKGRRLGLIETAPEEEKQQAGRSLLLDMTAIVDGRVADLVHAGLLTGPFIVPEEARKKLEEMKDSNDMVERGRARRGQETLERLEEAAGKEQIAYVDFGGGKRERLRMLNWLREEQAALISDDGEMLDAAHREGTPTIRLEHVGPAAKQVVLPGQRLRVKVVRKGRNSGQGVGFLNDGTMVVVENGEKSLGQTVDALSHTTFRASGGTMIFAKAGDSPHPEDAEVIV